MMRSLCLLYVFGIVVSAGGVSGGDWPEFRGPGGQGRAEAENVPTRWSATENVAWKAPLPGDSNGSPVVAAGRVFVTSAEDEGRQRHLHCFGLDDGALLWTRTATLDRVMPTHKTNQYGGSTPASDGRRVVVWHATAGLWCYDMEGEELWHRDLGEFRHQWGYGTSPVLLDDRVILYTGPGRDVFVTAIRLDDGKTLWRTDEPVENDGETNDAGKFMGSWSTPVVATVDGGTQIICSMPTRVVAYDPADGRRIWWCNGLRGERGDLAYTSPVIADDLCICLGGYQGPAIGLRMGGRGDVTDSALLWRTTEGNPQRIGSGVIIDGYLYQANAGPNLIQCLKADTGDVVWQQRSAAGAHWGSLVSADGRLYATGQDGTTLVFRPSPEGYDAIASNRLGESSNSTPAVVDGTIVIRTFDHLYCIRP